MEDCIVNGKSLIINFDDCGVKYEELYDPEIKEFYCPAVLSELMWKPQVFMLEKNWNHHMNDRNDIKLDHGYQFLIYSKFVVQQNVELEDLIDIIFKRFERSFPLNNCNLIVMAK